MKKLVSLLLVTVMIFAISSVSVFANDDALISESLYEDVFVEKYVHHGGPYLYKEYYYHHVDENDPDSEIDWVLVSASNLMCNPWFVKKIVADRVLFSSNEYIPFSFMYAVYDVKSGWFVELSNSILESYDDLAEVLSESGIGRPIGDADFDMKLTVLDATYIQRVLAELCEFDTNDDISGYYDLGAGINYISDYNRDGVRNILDATVIQMHLAELDTEPVEPEINEDLVYSEFNNMYGVDSGIEMIPFDTIYNGQQSYGDHKMSSDDFAVIIKSKEQYDSIFNVLNDEYDDAFFEDKWLVASVCIVTDAEMVAPIVDMGVRDNTLFIRVSKYMEDTNGCLQPIAPPYFSFVSVDKADVANVKEIIWL